MEQRSGFTIVELITVIVVIGILVTVTVFSFGAWRRDSAISEVKSDLNGVRAAMENSRNFNDGYPTSIPASFTPSDTVSLTYVSGTPMAYCIAATSKTIPTIVYHLDTTDGSSEPVAGDC